MNATEKLLLIVETVCVCMCMLFFFFWICFFFWRKLDDMYRALCFANQKRKSSHLSNYIALLVG